MTCIYCTELCIRKGRQKNGKQKYYYTSCYKYQQPKYVYQAWLPTTNSEIVQLIKASCGIRDIARKIEISPTTVLKRILTISAQMQKSPIRLGRTCEVDEMMTFIGNKEHRICIAYALDRETREVVSYTVGRRNHTTLRMVVNSLLLSNAREIRTDKCPLYKSLIPTVIHHVKRRGINRIERMNLTLRTHTKRLNRRTLAYSKSLLVLSAILRIYFWG